MAQTAVTLAPMLASSWTVAEPMAPVAPLTRTSCPGWTPAVVIAERA